MAKQRNRKPETQVVLDEFVPSEVEMQVEAPAEAEVVTNESEPEALPSIVVTIERAEDGRINVKTPGQPGRIAGSDEALPETLRQLGLDIVKRKLV